MPLMLILFALILAPPKYHKIRVQYILYPYEADGSCSIRSKTKYEYIIFSKKENCYFSQKKQEFLLLSCNLYLKDAVFAPSADTLYMRSSVCSRRFSCTARRYRFNRNAQKYGNV